MKRIIQTGIVIGTAFVLWQVSADARFLDLKKQKQAPVPEVTPAPAPVSPPNPVYKSKTDPSGISLQFEDLTLLDVLRNIQDETGILFSVEPSLETVPFNARIQADNWETAVRELLKGFSRVEVWTEKLETSRIWILSGGRNVEVARNSGARTNQQTARQTRPAPQRKPRFRVAPAPAPKPTPKLTAKPVAKSSIRIEDLPPHILFEPGVLTFFKSKGIALPENVKNMFGPNLEGLPSNMPISPHILNDPTFQSFIESKGIQGPKG
jgi:hypothetical protein